MSIQTRHVIDDETRIGEARRHAVHVAQVHGLDAAAAGRVGIAATELATNLHRHGGGGELFVQPVAANGAHVIELIAVDRGRGMENVERCLVDGYSTGGTAGNGLGAVRRLAQEFDIYSIAGQGAVVMARIGGSVAARFGAISVPVAGEVECGDAWRLAIGEDVSAALVADGLGHGGAAAEAARAATTAFGETPFELPRIVMERLHRASHGTRGCAAACARIERGGATSYAGVGNIYSALVSTDTSQGLVSYDGTLGVRATKMRQFEYRRGVGALLIMHSDGISARWDLAGRPGLLQRHPAIVAGVLYRDHARSRDDATVLVVD
jgi:anti-sigma regulatory factor (Ser/Thr protein kinase)